jgi:hypothetical protein
MQDVNTQVRIRREEGKRLDTADFAAFVEAEHHVRMSKLNFRQGLRNLLEPAGMTVHSWTLARFCKVEWVEEQVRQTLSREWPGALQSLEIQRPPIPGKDDFVFTCEFNVEQCERCCTREYEVAVDVRKECLDERAIVFNELKLFCKKSGHTFPRFCLSVMQDLHRNVTLPHLCQSARAVSRGCWNSLMSTEKSCVTRSRSTTKSGRCSPFLSRLPCLCVTSHL